MHFVFFKQKTAYEMRISDWSSDVCSSDLDLGGVVETWRRTVTQKGAEKIRVAKAGSTLVCCIGATIGKMGLLQRDSTFNQQINATSWGAEIAPLYGYHAMRFLSAEIAHRRSEEHTSELQSLMRISYAVF